MSIKQEEKMKTKRQRVINRCSLTTDTEILFIDDYKISNGGMIKGYYLLRVISKENYDKFCKSDDRSQKTFNDLCRIIKVQTTFLFGLTSYIKESFNKFKDEDALKFPEIINYLFAKNKAAKLKPFKAGKWHEFKGMPKEKHSWRLEKRREK